MKWWSWEIVELFRFFLGIRAIGFVFSSYSAQRVRSSLDYQVSSDSFTFFVLNLFVVDRSKCFFELLYCLSINCWSFDLFFVVHSCEVKSNLFFVTIFLDPGITRFVCVFAGIYCGSLVVCDLCISCGSSSIEKT